MIDQDSGLPRLPRRNASRLRVFHTPDPGARLALHAYGLREWMSPGGVDRPLGTDDWLFISFSHPMDVGLDQGSTSTQGPALMIWRPHAPHLYSGNMGKWCHSWLHADGDDVRELVAEAALPLETPIPGIDPRCLERCIAGLHREVAGHARVDPAILRDHLHIFLREASRAVHQGLQERAPQALLELRAYLDRSFDQPQDLASLARRAGCSVPHLCARFRRVFATSPIAYVIDLRLRRARLLLADRSRQVGLVAREVGYADCHHFSKLFHHHFGYWPSEVRR